MSREILFDERYLIGLAIYFQIIYFVLRIDLEHQSIVI